jgi:hypothetical protein
MGFRWIRYASAASSFAMPLLISPAMHAQVLGNSGDAIFGAERLFGIRNEKVEVEGGGQAESTTISLGFANALTPYSIPRLSFDYLAARKFSVGGAIGYASDSVDVEATPVPLGSAEGTRFLFAGRVGFLHMFGRVLGIWPRGGITYNSSSVEGGADESDLALTLECMFPIVAAPHFGFITGLSFDQALTGKIEPPAGPDIDLDRRSLAWQFGLFGWI